MPVVECNSAAAASPRSCFTSRRAMALAPASASAWDIFQPKPLAPLCGGRDDGQKDVDNYHKNEIGLLSTSCSLERQPDSYLDPQVPDF